MIKRISYFLTNYKVERKRLDSKVSFKETIIAMMGSLLFTAILAIIPALIIFNFFVLDYLINILMVFILILIIAFSFSYSFFFILILKNKNENISQFSFKNLIIIESTIFSVLLIIMTIIIIQVVR